MALDFSAFKNKPIKSTATPLDFSTFQRTPIKSTATPLDFSAFQTKQEETIKEEMPFEATHLGIAVNTILDLPKAAKDILMPTRGYSEEELRKAKPTIKENILAVPKIMAEISTIGGVASGLKPLQKFSQTEIGDILADAGDWIKDFAQPKTVGEASAMRLVDALTLIPVGSIKAGATSARLIAQSKNYKTISKILIKENPKLTEETIETVSKILTQVDNVDDVQRTLNKLDFAMNEAKTVKESVLTKSIEPRKPVRFYENFVEDTEKSLTEEARKYKSAEEFVKAQGTPVYHRTQGDFEIFNKVSPTEKLAGKAGTYFTTNLTEALGFGKNIKETYISPNAKIKVEYAVDMPERIRAERIFKARDDGYDAIKLKDIQPLRGKRTELTKVNEDIAKLKPEINKLNQRMLDGEITLEQNLSDPLMIKWSALLGKRNPTHTVVFNTDIIKTKSQLKDIWNKAQTTSKEIQQKKPETKLQKQLEVPEKGFLVENSLTKSVEQKPKTVKEVKENFDPIEVKEIKDIPEKTMEVMLRQEAEPRFLSPNEVEYLEYKQIELSFIEDQISQHPAKPLKKYFSYRTGELPEVLGGGKTKFGKMGDDIAKTQGYENSEDARADIHNLFTLEERAKDLKEEIKELALIEKDEIALQKFLNKHPIKVGKTKVILSDKLTTRKIKQRPHYQSFVKYAEKYITRDIHPPILNRHMSMTAERVAEYLDGGIGGRVYREIVKPVYESAVEMTKELVTIKNEVKKFKVVEGGVDDRDASLFAQKKIDVASDKAKELAKYSRQKYDEWLVRVNEKRFEIGVEPIPKRKDYITHLNEINVLTELLGGVDRITIKDRISRLKNEMLDRDPKLTSTVAFERAQREVEGTTGLDMYIDARQPIFKYAKRRLGEYEKNPSVVRSLGAYSRSVMRYIYQAKNVAKNKAYKDALPANAKEFFRLWNTEQVAGRTPTSIFNPVTKKMINSIRGTLGANTILGNMATTVMQLTSFPQVVALAGARNTMYGIIQRLANYLSKNPSQYSFSKTKILRDLDIDFGMGNSLIDSLLIKAGEIEKVRNLTARTRQSIDFGRNLLMGIMQTADQFTVGASFNSFYRKAILDGLSPEKAMEYADIMTGKTQANYYKEALPPFLNTVGGKVLGQFGTYSFNQWEMFRKDFGKEFKLGGKTPKQTKLLFKHFIYALVGAYLVDMVSEDVFGRQPYNIKDLVDEGIAMIQGKTDIEHLVENGKETTMSYIPFMGNVKFGSMPPLLDFGSDLIQFSLGSDPQKIAKAKKDLAEKWSLSVLLPYGGNQVRKTLQGLEFEDESGVEKMKALFFGKWATQQGQQFFEDIKQKEITKNKIEKAVEEGDYSKLSEEEKISTQLRNEIRGKYSIVGNINDDEVINKLKELPKKTQQLLIGTYATSTQQTLNRKLQTTTRNSPISIEKLKEILLQKLKSGELSREEVKRKIEVYKERYK